MAELKYTTVEDLKRRWNDEVECDRGANIKLRLDALISVNKLLNSKKLTYVDVDNILFYLQDGVDDAFCSRKVKVMYLWNNKKYTCSRNATRLLNYIEECKRMYGE